MQLSPLGVAKVLRKQLTAFPGLTAGKGQPSYSLGVSEVKEGSTFLLVY